MDHDITVVLNDPLGGLVSFDAKPHLSLAGHGAVYFLGDRVDLPSAGAVGQDQKVVNGSDAAHVQDNNVASLVISGNAGTKKGMFNGRIRGRGGRASRRCYLQRTSF